MKRFIDWKLVISGIIICIIVSALNFFFFPKFPQIEKSIEENYKEAYKQGWTDNTNEQICLLDYGMAALSSNEPPFYRGCVTKEKADEMHVSYTSTFKEWCEMEDNCTDAVKAKLKQ